MTVSWIYYCWTEHTQNVCTCMKQYFYMFHLCIFEHVLCVGEGTGRKSTSPTLCMLWENGQIMCIPMSVRQCCITQGKKQCFWSLIQALFPYTVGWSKNIQLLFIYFFIIVEFVKPLLRKMPSLKVKTWQRLFWIFSALISDVLCHFKIWFFVYLYSWHQKQISQCWEESQENCGSHEIYHDRKINRVTKALKLFFSDYICGGKFLWIVFNYLLVYIDVKKFWNGFINNDERLFFHNFIEDMNL